MLFSKKFLPRMVSLHIKLVRVQFRKFKFFRYLEAPKIKINLFLLVP
jgi:hypothetical protein